MSCADTFFIYISLMLSLLIITQLGEKSILQ